jgi:sugar/nucleoside kinase (ribokinase family)
VNDQTNQNNLVITDKNQPVITVDNIKVAQFIYLLLNNQEIRDVIDTITSKAVLILGRFSEERKHVLDAIQDELRRSEHNYLPIVFDFQPSANQATLETIKTLASMARFVIADLTDARSVLQELQAIVPDFPSHAVRLMIKRSQHEYGMLDFIRRFPWVIKDPYEYENEEEVIASIENVIGPAEAKVKELRPK